MHRLIAALSATFCIPLAAAQGGPHVHPGAPKEAAPPAGDTAGRAGTSAVPGSVYLSPFADYRPFSAEVAPKAWRAANDEVREAGGHIGLMKGQPAPAAGLGSHGAKQPGPSASPERK